MSDIYTWISTTAFPALGSCWDFFKGCIADLISVVTSSRLVFIFALFLIGTIISVIVLIVTSIPDVSSVDSSYPDFKTIKQRDLYFSGFSRPFSLKLFAKLNAFVQRKKRQKENDVIYSYSKSVADEFFENNQGRMTLSINGFKFFAPNFEKRSWGNNTKYRRTVKLDSEGNVLKTSYTKTQTVDDTTEMEQMNQTTF